MLKPNAPVRKRSMHRAAAAQKAAVKAADKGTTAEAGAPKAGALKSTPSKTSTPRRSFVSPSAARPAAGITFAELHEDFLRARRVEGIRPTSLRTYRGSLLPWAQWCAASGVECIGQVLTKHAEDYLLSLQDRKLSERTIRNQAIVIKAALKFAFQQGHLASERLYRWKIPRMSRASVYMPDHAEVGIILATIPQHWSAAQNPLSRFRNASARTFFSRRDTAIVAVQVSTGLCISETLGLRLDDYSAEQKTLIVTHSKSGRPRAVPVGAHLAPLLADWLRVRPRASPSDFLFVTDYGTRLHRESWGHQFQRYIAFARTQGSALPRITLHSLRHLAGTAMAEQDLYHASLMLGHSSVTITASNYLHARPDQIRATHAAADPLAQILTRGRPAGNTATGNTATGNTATGNKAKEAGLNRRN